MTWFPVFVGQNSYFLCTDQGRRRQCFNHQLRNTFGLVLNCSAASMSPEICTNMSFFTLSSPNAHFVFTFCSAQQSNQGANLKAVTENIWFVNPTSMRRKRPWVVGAPWKRGEVFLPGVPDVLVNIAVSGANHSALCRTVLSSLLLMLVVSLFPGSKGVSSENKWFYMLLNHYLGCFVQV